MAELGVPDEDEHESDGPDTVERRDVELRLFHR